MFFFKWFETTTVLVMMSYYISLKRLELLQKFLYIKIPPYRFQIIRRIYLSLPSKAQNGYHLLLGGSTDKTLTDCLLYNLEQIFLGSAKFANKMYLLKALRMLFL